jgi:cytochrome d ubiquinol oxidase subunit II
VIAVGAVLAGWGVAQYPYVLGTRLTLDAAAAPAQTLDALAVVALIAALTVVPSLGWLFLLTHRGRLGDVEGDASGPTVEVNS